METKLPTSESKSTTHTKINYSPPGWLVTWFDQVKLDHDRAVAFEAFRKRICEHLGEDNEACKLNNLWIKALDLLLANEAALLTKVEKL